jgi:hypothetical protein
LRLSEILTAPNQLTLLRMVFLPFIILNLLDRHYELALILFVLAGLTDMLDGLIARKFHQQSRLGEYLDPIADKLLLSTMFMVLAILHLIKWRYTVIVFSRDICILGVSSVLYVIAGLRKSFWESEHPLPNCRSVFCHARSCGAHALGFLRTSSVSAHDVRVYDPLCPSLRHPGRPEIAGTGSE